MLYLLHVCSLRVKQTLPQSFTNVPPEDFTLIFVVSAVVGFTHILRDAEHPEKQLPSGSEQKGASRASTRFLPCCASCWWHLAVPNDPRPPPPQHSVPAAGRSVRHPHLLLATTSCHRHWGFLRCLICLCLCQHQRHNCVFNSPGEEGVRLLPHRGQSSTFPMAAPHCAKPSAL